jgi:inhibitor of cysteine peptidase
VAILRSRRLALLAMAAIQTLLALPCGLAGAAVLVTPALAQEQGQATPAAISVRVGETFSIALDSTPGTGYSWELAQAPDEALVRLVGSEYVAPAGAAPPGAPGREVWTFAAVAPGQTTITLHYRRPWESGQAPARLSRTVVSVQPAAGPLPFPVPTWGVALTFIAVLLLLGTGALYVARRGQRGAGEREAGAPRRTSQTISSRR